MENNCLIPELLQECSHVEECVYISILLPNFYRNFVLDRNQRDFNVNCNVEIEQFCQIMEL